MDPDNEPVRVVKRRNIPSPGKVPSRLRHRWVNHRFGTSGGSDLEALSDFTAWEGSQVTESYNHPSWKRSKSGRFQGDIGGPFYTSKTWCTTKIVPKANSCRVVSDGGKQIDTCERVGPVLPFGISSMTLPPAFPRTSDSALNALGATAISRCKPTNAIADTSTFLAELVREGIPKLPHLAIERWAKGTSSARKSAGDYLDAEFGWRPIVSEVQQFARAAVMFEDALRQFERDRGRLVRRRYAFPATSTTTSVGSAGGPRRIGVSVSAETLGVPSPTGATSVVTTQVTTRQWFSGAFTYYAAPSVKQGSLFGLTDNARRLLSIELTPETLWNLAPWSWAIDWFSNAGDVISNLTDWTNDGLVMQYGYIMEHRVRKVTYSASGTNSNYAGLAADPVVFVSETKQRHRASPFGFGLTWNGLTPRQLAITAALGISKFG